MSSSLKHFVYSKITESFLLKKLFFNKHNRFILNSERKRVSSAYFNSIKGIYQGRRGFVIGNGPSLKAADLSKIKNEVSIASNMIHLIFDQTDWRPSYFTVADNLVWEKLHTVASTYHKLVLLVQPLDPEITNCLTYTMFWNGWAPSCVHLPNSSLLPFSSNLSNGLWSGSTVTYENLQLAVHLGLNPIYLIGCDHYYKGEEGSVELKPVEHTVKNHFSDSYRSVGEKVNPAPIENMTRSYEIAHSFALSRGIKILNATRGGHLDVFPRCDFDSIFEG